MMAVTNNALLSITVTIYSEGTSTEETYGWLGSARSAAPGSNGYAKRG